MHRLRVTQRNAKPDFRPRPQAKCFSELMREMVTLRSSLGGADDHHAASQIARAKHALPLVVVVWILCSGFWLYVCVLVWFCSGRLHARVEHWDAGGGGCRHRQCCLLLHTSRHAFTRLPGCLLLAWASRFGVTTGGA